MTRDNEERLALYTRARDRGPAHRAEHGPGSPAIARRRTSSRRATPAPAATANASAPIECWELDALSPTVIAGLIRDEIEALIEPKAWRKALARRTAAASC